MRTQSNVMPTASFEIEQLNEVQCDVLFYENVTEIEKEEQLNYEYDFYRIPAVYRENLIESIESNYEEWLTAAKRHEEEKAPLSAEEKILELEASQRDQDEEIISTQDAVNFLLFDSLGITTLKINEENKEMDKMAVYIANQILKGKVPYELAVAKYPQFKEDIDTILVMEGKSDLIK